MRKTILVLLVFLLTTTAFGKRPIAATDTDKLKQELQLRLDEWHQAGKFPGATLGVVLANGKSFSLVTGRSLLTRSTGSVAIGADSAPLAPSDCRL